MCQVIARVINKHYAHFLALKFIVKSHYIYANIIKKLDLREPLFFNYLAELNSIQPIQSKFYKTNTRI